MQSTTDLQSLTASFPATKRAKFDAGALLFQHGDQCENFVVLVSGGVRVELHSPDGDALLLYKIQESESCIMTSSCLLSESNYAAQAIAETAVELLLLPRKYFLSELDSSSQFRALVFAGFSERLSNLMSRIGNLTTKTIDQRLAAVLTHYFDANPSSDLIDLTHSQLASEVGTSREVISRRLAAFEKNGLVKRHRGQVQISDIEALRAH